MTPQLEIDAAKLATMRASELVAYWNDHVRAKDASPVEPPAAPIVVEAQPPAPAPAVEPPPAVRIARVVKVASAAPRKRGRKAATKSAAPRATTVLPPPASQPVPKFAQHKPASVVPLPLVSIARRDQLEQRFQALALEIGLAHAEALLRRVRAAARRLIE